MDFAEPDEHRALRAAVAAIAAKFGPRYYAERAAARRPCAELWQALGDAGFIGVNIREEYGGGGGGGLTEFALVCQEIAAVAVDAAIRAHGGERPVQRVRAHAVLGPPAALGADGCRTTAGSVCS